MGELLRAVACGILRGLRIGITGRPCPTHYPWCPMRRVVFEVPTSFYEQNVTRAPKPIRTNARFLE